MQKRTGSRTPTRVCQTAAEARAERQAGREFLESGQRRVSAESGGG
jgi:hypothetical protein